MPKVFRQQYTRPIPDGAKRVTATIKRRGKEVEVNAVQFQGDNGRPVIAPIVESGNGAGTRCRLESPTYYGRVDRKVVRLCANKAAAEMMLNRLLAEADVKRATAKTARVKVKAGAAYVAQAGDVFKIGSAGDVGVRLAQLQTGQAEQLTLVRAIRSDDAAWLERLLHQQFEGRRVRGEWFALTADDLALLDGIDVWDRERGPFRLEPVAVPFVIPT